MKFSKLLLLGALSAAQAAHATIVEFYGTGTYNTYNYTTSSIVQRTFSLGFSYDTAASVIDAYPTQVLRPAATLSLTVNLWDGSVWSHTSNDVRITMNNAVNGSWDGLTISTKWPLTETVDPFLVGGSSTYPVVNYSFELTKYGGGVFTDGDFNLPASPTFIGDLADWNVKHAKLYIFNGTTEIAAFNQPLTSLGAPSPIPEPSTWAAMAGAMALGVVAWQRRRKAAV